MVRPKEPVNFEEHTEVEVLIPLSASSDTDDPTRWNAAEALIASSKMHRPTWLKDTTDG